MRLMLRDPLYPILSCACAKTDHKRQRNLSRICIQAHFPLSPDRRALHFFDIFCIGYQHLRILARMLDWDRLNSDFVLLKYG